MTEWVLLEWERATGHAQHATVHSATLTHPPTHSLTHSPTHPLTHSPTHSLIHSPTHPPTHLPLQACFGGLAVIRADAHGHRDPGYISMSSPPKPKFVAPTAEELRAAVLLQSAARGARIRQGHRRQNPGTKI